MSTRRRRIRTRPATDNAMSYRAFKRLLGATSRQRECRFLFGAGILVLITLSFWLYAYLTEQLAYNQAVTTCRLLVFPILAQHHVPYLIENQEKVREMEKKETKGVS